MATQHYSTKIDWWIIFVLVFIMAFVFYILLWIGIEWYIVLIIALPLLGMVGLSISGISYVIKDDELGVKSNVKWMWYPIENIKEVRKVKSVLAAPATSFTRVQIKFKRGTTKTAVPLEISPTDRDQFIQDLLKINPNIKVIP
ncbi:MAG: PH domain-containing protein [Muribaculaceae bacterium]|nr:PH domain-containing protein [Muribaculaceae bacterium]